MKKVFSIFACLIFAVNVFAQLPNQNMYVVRQFNLHPIPPQFGAPWSYSGLWGYIAPNGREYAILGCGLGTAFYDVTDSATIREVDFFSSNINLTNPDQGNLWREVKVYSHYAYVVSEADTSGVEIYDLQYLPDSVVFVRRFLTANYSSTHTISQEGPYLYLNGANPAFGFGTVVLDLTTDPTNPVVRGKWNTRYVHDCRVKNDTIFAMNIVSSDGQITVIDARNKDSLRTVTQWLNNPNPSPHNCALSSNRNYLFATDEVGSLPRLLKVWSIEDLSNTTLVATWQPTNITTSRIHNVETYDDTAVIAHYTAGVRVLNISNPSQPNEFAWYDTYPLNNGDTYAGCWAVYKFPSGKIIASDMNTGLYVLKVSGTIGINEENNISSGYKLEQNYPNPFNPVTSLEFEIPRQDFVSLKVFDLLGNEVAVLVNEKKAAGNYKIEFDGTNYASGVYFYKLESGNFSEMRKMVLIK